MKKIISIAFALVFCLVLSACGDTEQAATSPASSESASSSTPVETAVTDEGEYDGGKIKILDAEWMEGEDGTSALKVFFTYTNESTEPCYLYSAFAIRAFQNGLELDEIGLNDESEECQNLTAEVKDGAALDCAMIFEVNSDDPVEVLVGTPTADEETIAQKLFSR